MTTRRRIMRKFSITELSSVDRPAQAHATMTLLKRHETQETDDMQFTKIAGDTVATFSTFDEAVAAICKAEGVPRSEGMRLAARAAPDLVQKYNDEGRERFQKASDAIAKRSSPSGTVAKAGADFEAAVQDVMRQHGLKRSAAMAWVRNARPDLYQAYQSAS